MAPTPAPAPDPATSVDGREAPLRFADLSYERFRAMAGDPLLAGCERIGYPPGFRSGHEEALLRDLAAKLPALEEAGATVLDIGCGCDELALRLIAQCGERGQTLHLVDSPEMLAQLPEAAHVRRHAGRFPDEVLAGLQQALAQGADAIVCYGVLQVVFLEANPFTFVDAAARLLAPGGRLLFGEVPNASMRRRFLASAAGRAHHRAYMRTQADPDLAPVEDAGSAIDDGVLAGLLLRLRASGLHAWLMPQARTLPLANRREDLLVERP